MLISGLDVGTTGCKLTVYDSDGKYLYNSYKEYNISRKSGEHELDAEMLIEAVYGVIKDVAEKYSDLRAIGVTTFGEAFVTLDKDDNILFPTMLYTDQRGSKEKDELVEKLGEDTITKIAGVKPHQMYSVPKIMWIKKNKPEIYGKISKILLMADFVVYMLSGKRQIEYSLAARTLGLDIRNKCWSKEIFDAAGIDISLMSELVKPGTVAGNMKNELAEKFGFSGDVKIVNACHDQVAAAVGSGIFEVGSAVDGTGTVECITPLFSEIPEDEALYKNGYSVVPYVFDNTYVCYAFSFTGGATIKWYRDNFAKYEQMIAEKEGKNVYAILDGKVKDEPTGILVMPHFAGAATPYMDNDSKAVIIGLTLENNEADIYKALMEGVTYELMLNVENLENAGIVLEKIYATGGGASSDVWLQIKADVLGKNITALDAKEAGTCGTCMITAVAIGACNNLKEAKEKFVREKKTFIPNGEKTEIYRKNFEAYKNIYNAVRPVIKTATGK